MTSQELYEQLKNQLALDHNNSCIHANLLNLLIEDIGEQSLFELIYDYLPTEQIKEDDSRFTAYDNLVSKQIKSLEKLQERSELIKNLLSKPNINNIPKEQRLVQLINYAHYGLDSAVSAFYKYRIFIINTEGKIINIDDLYLQIKQKEKYQKSEFIINDLLKVYEQVVNNQWR